MKEVILTEDPGDLRIGDEIISNSGSELRCYKVMETPRVSKKKTWYNGKTRYIAVRCKSAVTEKTSSVVRGSNNKPWTKTWKEYEFRTPTEDDPIIKVDLNFKQMIIIKREEEWME